ncbi:MAG: co-chaperone DjlA [Methylococcales bacterium]|nr:co-chaperone DjlA [Methylococcales bacterium]
MSWFSTVVGGTVGFLLGGPIGAVLGASVGHQFNKGVEDIAISDALKPNDQPRAQMAFFTATFSVMGHLAKADGRVSPEEIALATRIMDEMGLAPDMRATAIDLFKQGKQADFPLDTVLTKFYKNCRFREDLIRLFLAFQIQVALADGTLDAREEKLLLYISNKLSVSRLSYERLKIQLMAQQRFHAHSHQVRNAPHQISLQEAYRVLGLKPSATKAEVKKAYRRLMSQNHPDKLIAQGLPEETMRIAKEKTQKISKAYEVIHKAG